MVRRCAKGCFASLEVEEEGEVADHCCAVCIVKRPCCSCWGSLVIAIFITIVGIRGLIAANQGQEAGPLRGPDEGLTYPYRNIVARRMDALKLSREAAETAYANSGFGRRLEANATTSASGKVARGDVAATEAPSTALLFEPVVGKFWAQVLSRLPVSAGGGGGWERLMRAAEKEAATRLPSVRVPRGINGSMDGLMMSGGGGGSRRLSESTFQDEHLLSAFFIFKARGGSDASVFSDDALAELCQLHNTLMTDATRSGPYEGYEDFCLKSWDWQTNAHSCKSGLTPLAFFYDDGTCDIEGIEISVFSSPNLETIGRMITVDDNLAGALAQYPSETPAIAATLTKLFACMGTWMDGGIHRSPTCSPSMKKDTQAVLRLLAAIRANPVFDDVFGGMINFFFDAGFSEDNLVSTYTRSSYDYGGPLKYGDFTSAWDRQSEQEDLFVKWFWTHAQLQDSYDEHDRSLWSSVQPTGFIPPLLLQMLVDLLVKDGLMALAPLVLVFLTVWFQTRSMFIALVTIVECIFSFTGSIFVMVTIGIKWMAFEQFLAVYIVLAIGADDVFVFMDAYKQSFYMGPKVNESLTKRMSWVYRRAGLAMLITSLTTASAFVATALSSPIPTLQNFGIFAAAVIIFDYTLVMTMLCSAVVIYHNSFETKPGACCACCTCAPAGSAVDWWLCLPTKLGGCTGLCKCPATGASCCGLQETTTAIAQGGGPRTEPGAKPLYVRIFEDWFPFDVCVKRTSTRALSIFAFIAVLIPAVYGVSKLEPQTSAEQFLPESHPFQRFFTATQAFMSSQDDETVEMQIMYGFDPDDPFDLSGVNRLVNPNHWGTPKHSPSFVLDEAAQEALVADCALIGASPIVKSLYLGATQTTAKLSFCWPEAFKAYRQCMNYSWPVPGDASDAIFEWKANYDGDMNGCPAEANPSYRDTGDEREGWWYDSTDDLGWVEDSSSTYGVRLAWVKVRASSEIKEDAYMPSSTLRGYYDEWQALVATLNEGAPASLGPAMQTASRGWTAGENKWLHMVLQETYVRMALTGVAIGLSIAFVVLLVATMNVIVAVLSIVTIAFAICCVIGTIVMRGWQLGSSESLSMMILTGFAVDYVVHLAHAYMESDKASRVDRVHDALRDLGISVFWGMLTSFIAAYVLSTLQLQFFAKFGGFFLLTILWAYLWAVLVLMPALAFIGPSGVGPHAKSGNSDGAPTATVEMSKSGLMHNA